MRRQANFQRDDALIGVVELFAQTAMIYKRIYEADDVCQVPNRMS